MSQSVGIGPTLIGEDPDDVFLPAHSLKGSGMQSNNQEEMNSDSDSLVELSLFEKIVGCHPIWYLPFMGRLAASHLLKGKEAGVFIVRASSKLSHPQNPSMALSVRLPIDFSPDIDHYLIETSVAGVRLEGSPNFFRYLPQLLQYYCEHGEELHVKLRLPSVIMSCNSKKDLQSLAFLGADFWTSDHFLQSRSNSAASHHSQRSADCRLNSQPQLVETKLEIPAEPNVRRSQSVSAYPSGRLNLPMSISNPEGFGAARRLNSTATCDNDSATTLPDRLNRSFMLSNGHAKPKTKPRSESASAAGSLGRQFQLPFVKPPIAVQSESNGERRSFRFRNIFDGSLRRSASAHNTPESKRKDSSHLMAYGTSSDTVFTDPGMPLKPQKQIVEINGTGEYFSPSSFSEHSRSRSSLLSDDREEMLLDTPTMTRRQMNTFKPTIATIEDFDCYSVERTTPPQKPQSDRDLSVAAVEALQQRNNEKLTVNTVKVQPSHQRSDSLPTQSHSEFRPKPKPMPKPIAPLRREKSDVGFRGVQLAGSVPAKALKPPIQDDVRISVEELRKRRLESVKQSNSQQHPDLIGRESSLRKAVVSPLSTISNGAHSPLSKFVRNASFSSVLRKPLSTQPQSLDQSAVDTASVKMRVKSENRRSAPSLADSASLEHGVVISMIKDLKVKQQQKFAAVGLDTISENLPVPPTPPALRKIKPSPPVAATVTKHRSDDSRSHIRHSQSFEDLLASKLAHPPVLAKPIRSVDEFPKDFVAAGGSKRGKSKEKSVKLTGDDTSSSGNSDSGGISKTSAIKSVNGDPRSPHGGLHHFRRSTSGRSSSSRSKRNENVFHQETSSKWMAVTSEMKKKQRTVARVLPSPQVPSSSGAQIVQRNRNQDSYDHYQRRRSRDAPLRQNSGGLGYPGHESEYAMLSELSDFVPNTTSFSSGGSSKRNTELDDDARSVVSQAGTVFCEPWDSNVWENLLSLVNTMEEPTCDLVTYASKVVEDIAEADESADLKLDELPSCSSGGTPPKKSPRKLVPAVSPPSAQPVPVGAAVEEKVRLWQENNVPLPSPHLREFSRHLPKQPGEDGVTPPGTLESGYMKIIYPSAEKRRQQNDYCSNGDPGISPLSARFVPATTPARLRSVSSRNGVTTEDDPARRIQEFVENLSQDRTTIFGGMLHNFIQCTLEAQEHEPSVALRNTRQFMNGIKNYLVKHGEGQLHDIIETERSKLRPTEFLNIDAILEGVLNKIVLLPLKPHIYSLMVEHSKNDSLPIISENLVTVRSKTALELGLKTEGLDATTIEKVRSCLRRMQNHYSPMKKLENLLKAVSIAYYGQSCEDMTEVRRLPSADELVAWFVYILSRCSFVGCEIESEYMWALLHPALLSGESSYYLTALSSAIHVLKNTDLLPNLIQQDDISVVSELDGSDGFIKVAIPDEIGGSICYHTFPIVTHMSTSKFCKMIAHRFGITNPEDYGLYLLVDGYETILLPNDFPEVIKERLKTSKKSYLFAYKRQDAKIAWPRTNEISSPRLERSANRR